MTTFAYYKKRFFEIGVVSMLIICMYPVPLSAQIYQPFYTIGEKKTVQKQVEQVSDSLCYDEDEYVDEQQIADVASDSLRHFLPMVSLPLKSISVNSPFGMRRDPLNRKKTRMHNGLDLKAKYEKVYSMLPGVVSATGYSANGGYFVTVNHDACVCLYLHLSKIEVHKGQHVSAGQTIAVSGNSGKRTTGAHLHLSCRIGDEKGKFFDPMVILNFVLEQMLANTKL